MKKTKKKEKKLALFMLLFRKRFLDKLYYRFFFFKVRFA
jgi:hypothetical protein